MKTLQLQQCPIDRLPEEILAIALALSGEEVDVTKAPAIMQVCKKWQRISLGCKEPWTSIRVPAHASVLAVIKVLSLSGNKKLSLDMREFQPPFSGSRTEYNLTYQLVLAAAPRWRFIRLNIDFHLGLDDLLKPSSSLAQSITSLEGLEVVLPYSPGSQPVFVTQLVETLSRLPSMRQLRVSGIYRGESRIPTTQVLYWTSLVEKAPAFFSSLTHINLSGAPTLPDCITVLSHCPGVLEAEFQGVKHACAFVDVIGTLPTRLEYLRVLKVSARNDASLFLRHFQCPRLKFLSLSNGAFEQAESNDERISKYELAARRSRHFTIINSFLSKCALLQQVAIHTEETWQFARLYFSESPLLCAILRAEIKFSVSSSDPDADVREYTSFKDVNGRLYFDGMQDGKATIVHKRKNQMQRLPLLSLSPLMWGTAFWN